MSSPVGFTVSSINVAGISGYTTNIEYTAANVFTAYQADVATIQNILFKQDNNGNVVPISATDLPLVTNAINDLKSLLAKGRVDPTTGQTNYLTVQMAQSLDVLFRSLQGVGLDTSSPVFSFPSLELAVLWQFEITSSAVLQGLFTYADNVTNQSLQSLIELQYVKTGNDLLSESLGQLEVALGSTQNALNTLSNLQNLHNQITIQSFASFSAATGFSLSGVGLTPDQFVIAYQGVGSSYYGSPITPTILPPGGPNYNFPSWMTYFFTNNPVSGQARDSTNTPINGEFYFMVPKTAPLPNDFLAKFGIRQATDSDNLAPALQPKNNPNSIIYLTTSSDSLSFATLASQLPTVGYTTNTVSSTITQLVPPSLENDPLQSAITSILGLSLSVQYIVPPSLNFLAQTPPFPNGPARDPSNNVIPNLYFFNIPSTSTPPSQFLTALGLRLATAGDNLAPSIFNPAGFTTYVSTNGNSFKIVNTLYLILQNDGYAVVQPIPGTYQLVAPPSDPDQKKILNLLQFIPGNLDNYKNKLVSLRLQLSAMLPVLSGLTPLLPNGMQDPTTLFAKVKQVYQDLQTVFVNSNGVPVTSATSIVSAYGGLSNWLLDHYNTRTNAGSSNLAGLYQQNITYAISAGQALNSSQGVHVQQFLYVFNEYYQSATSILQKVTQILKQISQAIQGQ